MKNTYNKKGSAEPTIYANIEECIKNNYPKFYNIILESDTQRILQPNKRSKELTLLVPDAKFTKKISDMMKKSTATVEDFEAAIDIVINLVLRGCFKTAQDFRACESDIPTKLRKKLNISEITEKEVKLANGAKILLDKPPCRFVSRRGSLEQHLSVLPLSGELLPSDLETTTTVQITRKMKEEKKGKNEDTNLEIIAKFIIFIETEELKALSDFELTGEYHSKMCYVVANLLEKLSKESCDLISILVCPEPIITFYNIFLQQRYINVDEICNLIGDPNNFNDCPLLARNDNALNIIQNFNQKHGYPYSNPEYQQAYLEERDKILTNLSDVLFKDLKYVLKCLDDMANENKLGSLDNIFSKEVHQKLKSNPYILHCMQELLYYTTTFVKKLHQVPNDQKTAIMNEAIEKLHDIYVNDKGNYGIINPKEQCLMHFVKKYDIFSFDDSFYKIIKEVIFCVPAICAIKTGGNEHDLKYSTGTLRRICLDEVINYIKANNEIPDELKEILPTN